MKFIKHILSLLILLSTSIALSQVKFEAEVSKNKLAQNERLRIDFKMNQDGDQFAPPDFNGFAVIGGPNTSVSNSWINGKRSFSKTYSYFLRPNKQGSITIQSASIEIEGVTYKTKPIAVTVTKASANASTSNGTTADAQAKATENIHLVAELSNAKPYLNEAITVVYKLYVGANTGVSNWREIDKPKYNGFWSKNIEIKGLKIENGTYKGEDYRYVVLRKAVLYPQKTGKLELEPLSLDLTVDVPTRRRDIFGRRLSTQIHKTISAGTRTLNVKELPLEGKPDNFTGAVGNFNFNLNTSKKELNANESLQLKVSVSGKGNLRLFQLPKVKVPSSLEVYEPEHDEKVSVNLGGMQGTVSDSYTIVPQYKGKYPIPNISFSYFDPKTESYKQIEADETIINVIEGPVNSAVLEEQLASNEAKQNVITNNNQFEHIKSSTTLTSVKADYFFKSKGFWSSMLLPLLAIPLAMFYHRKREERSLDVVGNKTRKADRLAKKFLGEAKRNLGKKESFYLALEKALHNYLKAKLTIETSELSKDKIQELLLEKSVDQSVISDFTSILENCELARYSPITQVTMQQDYEKAAKAITAIDKQMK